MTETTALVPTGDAALTLRKFDDTEYVELVKDTYCKGATDLEFKLFLETCKRTRLDPVARQIYAMKRWDSSLKRESLQAMVGIDGFRLIAERTGQYGGQTEPQWCGDDGEWLSVWSGSTPPVAARIGVKRNGFQEPLYAVAHYAEYAQKTKDGKPNRMWTNMPANQLAKCAEALALRKAFPADLSGVYSPDEMAQADNPDKGYVDITPPTTGRHSLKGNQFDELRARITSAATADELRAVYAEMKQKKQELTAEQIESLRTAHQEASSTVS